MKKVLKHFFQGREKFAFQMGHCLFEMDALNHLSDEGEEEEEREKKTHLKEQRKEKKETKNKSNFDNENSIFSVKRNSVRNAKGQNIYNIKSMFWKRSNINFIRLKHTKLAAIVGFK